MSLRSRLIGTLVGVLFVVFASSLGAQSFSDNFDAAAVPELANGYNLNEELDVRQSGDKSPALYTIIRGDLENVQVNSDEPDLYGDESGLGKLCFLGGYAAVQLDMVPPASSVSVAVEVTPIANNAAMDRADWANINIGATGGDGFVNNAAGGVGMLIRDNGGYQVFNNGPLIADGSVAVAGTYFIEASLNAAGDRYSLSINGEDVLTDAVVTTTGTLIQLGGYNGATPPPDQPYNMNLFDNLEVTIVEPPVVACATATPQSGNAPLTVDFSAACTTSIQAIDTYDWNFGDGTQDEGEAVSHEYQFGDNYTVTMTATDALGNSDTSTFVVTVYEVVSSFEDDFERPDGPVDGWTPIIGSWNIVSGQLESTTAATENWVWAGSPPILLPKVFELDYSYEFLTNPGGTVGRHGGIMFCATSPTTRATSAGYLLDWIDRASDHGVRVSRYVGATGTTTQLASYLHEDPLSEPPTNYRVIVDATRIQVYADDVMLGEVRDSTYRGGFVGFWQYQNLTVGLDDVAVSIPEQYSSPCFSQDRADLLTIGVERAFDASCSEASAAATYSWNFGDGESAEGVQVSHAYAAAGTYTVTLTVDSADGVSNYAAQTVQVVDALPGFFDGFDRADGAVSGWTVASGNWSIQNETLYVDAPGAPEPFIYAGAPIRPFGAVDHIEFEARFLAQPIDGVGRHGGAFFCAQAALPRAQTSGYTIDWIDRCDATCDHGYRFITWNNGVATAATIWGAQDPDPGEVWRVEFEGDLIRLVVDDEVKGEISDGKYRTGYLGFWCYTNGEMIEFDNVTIGEPPAVDACFSVSPDSRAAVGTDLTFDAGCSQATSASINSYDWDFSDGATATGEVVEHSFDQPGFWDVTLTIQGSNGTSGTLVMTIEVYDIVDKFSDDFDRVDGTPGGWSVVSGDWQIANNELHITVPAVPASPEAYIFAGTPALWFDGVEQLSYTFRFDAVPPPPIGRHAGIMLFSQKPASRYDTGNSGYTFDWIDRCEEGGDCDHGYRFIKWTNGVADPAIVFSPEDLDPGEEWAIEVDGDIIRLIVDGVVKAEMPDFTYRSGHIGYWSYVNDQSVSIDDVVVGEPIVQPGTRFRRGDVDVNGKLEVTDPINNLVFQFLGTFAPTCLDALDFDDNGKIEITDPIGNLTHQFLGDPPPAPPGKDACGLDPTDDDPARPLDCAMYPPENC